MIGKNMAAWAMSKVSKASAYAVLSAVVVSAAAVPAYADVGYDDLGDGSYVIYDDDSAIIYSADDDSYVYMGNDGIGYLSSDGDSEFIDYSSLNNSTKSSSSSSSKNAKYAGSRVYDAYWDGYTARWSADYRSNASFTVTLYRDSHKVTSKSTSGSGSMNLREAIVSHGKSGNYYFVVKAKWPGNYTDSDESGYNYVNIDILRGNTSSSSSSSPSPSSSGGPSSSIASGWRQENGVWKYMKTNGQYAANGWENINGKWYNFDAYGNMRANQWIQKADDAHVWYYVGPNGDMLTNQYIGQYYVNENGECYA